jgi:hypothetical protein
MFNFGDENPTFVVIGLQQVEAKENLIGHFLQGKSVKDAWGRAVEEYLAGERGYTQVSKKSGGGCMLMVYFKSANANLQLAHISDISHSKMSFNLLKNDRNLLLTKLKIFDTSVLFANCYFTKCTDLLQLSE